MATPPPHPQLSYAPGLDGLRAIAVLAVIAYHADARWAPGGFLGVDVFFVLSGFLITSLLLTEHRGTGHIHLPSFWARRGRRLLPALFVLLAVLCLWSQWWADPVAQDRFRGEAFAGLGYFANWHFAATGTSYFDAFGAASPVRHLWSLAIEEQFYVVWPLVTAGILSVTRLGRRALLTLAVAGATVSATLMALRYQGGDPSRIYYGTDTHAFGLLFGAALAVVTTAVRDQWQPTDRALRMLTAIGMVALGLLGSAIALLPDDGAFTYRGGIVVASLVTVPVVFAATTPGPLARLLSWRPLVAIGLVSYGLYLWHWPVWTILDEQRVGVGGAALELVHVVVLAAVTVASYALIERPIRRGVLRGTWIRVAAPAAAIGVAAAVLTTTVAPTVFTPPVTVAAASRTFVAPFPTRLPPKPGVMIVGDSSGGSAVVGFDAVLGSSYHVVPAAFVPETAGRFCPLDLDLDAIRAGGIIEEGVPEPACDWSAKWPGIVQSYRPRVVVVMFGIWDAQAHRVHGRWLEPGTRAFADHMATRVRCAIDTLTATGAHALFVLSPPTIQVTGESLGALNRVITQVAAADPARASVVDVSDVIMGGGVGYRWDTVHYTEEGARVLAEALRGAIGAAHDAPPSPPPAAPVACAPGAVA